jgi:hypothetical protein
MRRKGVVTVHDDAQAQRLARQHGLVNCGYLMRQGFYVGRVDGHHRVEEEGEVYALRLDRQFEGIAITIE